MYKGRYVARLCFDVPGWAYHQRCKALKKYAPEDFLVTIGPNYGQAFKDVPHDVALQLVYPCTKDIKNHIDKAGYKTKVIAGYNVSANSPRHWFKGIMKHADHCVINSQLCWEQLGKLDKTTWISNGVDRDVYQMKKPVRDRKIKVISIGSKFHAENKGFKDVLPEVQRRLEKEGIETDFKCVNSHGINRLTADQLVEWYNDAVVYVVASKDEGTPNPALEAASCGCAIVSTRVGNMPELIKDGVNGYLVDRNAKSIANAVCAVIDQRHDMIRGMQDEISSWCWSVRSRVYFDLFRSLLVSEGSDIAPVNALGSS